VYKITKQGERHLEEWAAVLEHLSQSMTRFVCEVRETLLKPAAKRTKSS
jgi:hypothetical protein